ncbi:hypothetical protein Fot_34836 [Forsythia ovata]|uniref:Uncharacterized protein n=1 Tax=Forsythia ovata TaxID=205694 RepID=A0ABD1SJU3_9LAMI
MYTFRNHVLNCEMYQVLAMKVDELRSTVEGAEDIDAWSLENTALHAQLNFFEDAKVWAVYDITKAGTIQMKVESQLRVCQNIIHAKDKELTKALAELSRAKDLLANLEVPGYADRS